MILGECKHAAKWSGTWIGKLADDVAKAGASLGAIVSAEMPAGLDSSGLVDSIWVTDYRHATTLAAGLREAVITAWRHKVANAGRDEKPVEGAQLAADEPMPEWERDLLQPGTSGDAPPAAS